MNCRWLQVCAHTCDVTHLYEWHGSLICVTWRTYTHTDNRKWVCTCETWLHMCDMTSHVWICMTRLIYAYDMTHLNVWYDSFICAAWHIHVCYMTVRTHREKDVSPRQSIRINESCHTYEWVTGNVSPRQIIRINDSFHTYEWVISHIYEWVMSHIHVSESCHTHASESCHTHVWVVSRSMNRKRDHMKRESAPKFSYKWVMSHIWASHLTQIWESHVTHTRASHVIRMYESCQAVWIEREIAENVSPRNIIRTNESCHTYEWVISHIYEWVMSHIHVSESCHTHASESCHTHVWVMSRSMHQTCHRLCTSHDTHTNESWCIYKRVMTHLRMRHVANMRSHVAAMSETCHTHMNGSYCTYE